MRSHVDTLTAQLDAWEYSIRWSLAEPDTSKRISDRRLDLQGALEALGEARKELADNPAGAALALRLIGVMLHWYRLPAEKGRAALKQPARAGSAPKVKRTKRAARGHAAIRKEAAKLAANLTPSAKAKILARKFPLGERQIRRVITAR